MYCTVWAKSGLVPNGGNRVKEVYNIDGYVAENPSSV